jgi:hypothetical protein
MGYLTSVGLHVMTGSMESVSIDPHYAHWIYDTQYGRPIVVPEFKTVV